MPIGLQHLCPLLLLISILNCPPLQANEPQAEPNRPIWPNLRTLVANTLPSVVSLQVEVHQPPNNLLAPLPRLPGQHGNLGLEGSKELGAGLVINDKGQVLTNYHLIEHARRIDVEILLPQGKWIVRPATLVSYAADFDLALLQIQQAPPLRAVVLGDSELMEVGDRVLAIGNPFGFKHSVSLGILSGKGRQITGPEGKPDLYQLLQTDAAINPGNSGGPLLSEQGECIGLNTAIHTAGHGIGFAIASNTIKKMLPKLQERGPQERTWFGIQLQNLTASLAASYGRDQLDGALIVHVSGKSPAAQAGLQEEDILLQFDHHAILHLGDVRFWASLARPNQPIPIQIWRKGQLLERQVRLEQKPMEALVSSGTLENKGEGNLGFVVTELTPEMSNQLALPSVTGALIKQVTPYSIAANAGLSQGDIVVGTPSGPISGPQQLSRWLQQQPVGQWLRLKLLRNGNVLFVAMQKPEKAVPPYH